MEDILWTFAVALDSRYLRFADLIAWADSQVMALENPPLWLMDVCLSKTHEEASATLLTESQRHAEKVGLEWRYYAEYGSLHLGFLWLRFERDELTLAELLDQAGRYSDIHGCDIDCESFYMMLNEIDGGGPTVFHTRPLEIRAADLFAPMAAQVRGSLAILSYPSLSRIGTESQKIRD